MNFRKLSLTLTVSSYLFVGSPLRAYEVETHAQITYNAYLRSSLFTSAMQQRLGIDRFIGAGLNKGLPPFDKFYMDYFDLSAAPRQENKYELDRMSDVALKNESLNISGRLMRGAIREDDSPGESPLNDPDAQGAFHREFNHFFDPQKDRPLTRVGIGTVYALDTHGVSTGYDPERVGYFLHAVALRWPPAGLRGYHCVGNCFSVAAFPAWQC